MRNGRHHSNLTAEHGELQDERLQAERQCHQHPQRPRDEGALAWRTET